MISTTSTPKYYFLSRSKSRPEQQHGGRASFPSVVNKPYYHNIIIFHEMYFPIGWPKYFSSRDVHCGELKSLRYNRDRSLLAVISDHSVCIWNNRVSIKFPFCRLSTGYHLCEYHLTVRALADKQSYIDKDS